MSQRILTAVLAASLFALPLTGWAHGGEDHGAPVPASAPSPAPAPAFSADGSVFQVVVKPEHGHSVVYLADLDSNAPVGGGSIDAESGTWQGKAAPTPTEGVYDLPWQPAAGEAFDLTLTVSAGGRDDLLLVEGTAAAAAKAKVASSSDAKRWGHFAGGAAAILLTVGLIWAARRRPFAVKAAILIVGAVLLLWSTRAFAHAGHDGPEPVGPAAVPGSTVRMPKGTQFLLGIRTMKVEPREAADSVRVLGRVVPDPGGYARVQPSQPARVVADPAFPIPVPGQRVHRGQVLAVLEPTLTTLERSDKRAALYKVESDIAIQERELVRLESLGAYTAAKTREDTRTQLEQLRRERAQIAGTALGRELLTAPIDGVVTDIHVVPGEVVGADNALIEIVDPKRLRVEAIIHDLAVADRISGASATSKLIPDQTFALRLLGVSPRVDQQDQGIHALFSVADDGARLKIGMPVDVFLESGATRLKTAVPRDAIAEVGGRQVVFVRAAAEAFTIRPIRVERVIGPLAEVGDGLQAGERIVIQGVDQMKAAR